jgi:probable HAF family extracellular repeat protein
MYNTRNISIAITTSCFLGLATASPTLAASFYSIIDLGSLGSDPNDNSFITTSDINNLGQVVGTSTSPKSTGGRAFIWDKTTGIRDLGVLGTDSQGNNSTRASSINDLGQIVGSSTISNGSQVAFLWEPGTGIRDLGILKDVGNQFDTSFGRAINNSSQVVGDVVSSGVPRGYFWDTTKTQPELVILGNQSNSSFSTATDINDNGEIAGWSFIGIGPRGFVWDNKGNVKKELSVLGIRKGTDIFSYSSPSAINNNGQVVGVSTTSASTNDTAVLWDKNGNIKDLGVLLGNRGDNDASNATDINNLGQVIGNFFTFGDKPKNGAFIWENNTINDLQTLIPANSGWLLENATAINDRGEIVGSGTFNGKQRAFLLTPQKRAVPESTSILGLFIAVALSILKTKKLQSSEN